MTPEASASDAMSAPSEGSWGPHPDSTRRPTTTACRTAFIREPPEVRSEFWRCSFRATVRRTGRLLRASALPAAACAANDTPGLRVPDVDPGVDIPPARPKLVE